MQSIGFLGYGKIGRAMMADVRQHDLATVAFIQDPFAKEAGGIPVIPAADEALYRAADLVVECATADALQASAEMILRHANLMAFSLTAFADEAFEREATALAMRYGRAIFCPHGAILGLDGVRDARDVLHRVCIDTVKNPNSLGREDTERTILYEGDTRGACRRFPRNVNVHAAVAMAGLGFDRTQSRIIADPAVHTNSHTITIEGEGVSFTIEVSSYSTGGVTGAYTPLSACGSLRRVLSGSRGVRFV
jgi:aspartate dehydrogenase